MKKNTIKVLLLGLPAFQPAPQVPDRIWLRKETDMNSAIS